MNVRQSSVDPVVVNRQTFVIQAEQMKNRRVEIMDRDWIGFSTKSERVGRSETATFFDTRAGKPAGKAERIVIATISPRLEHRHAAEFCGEDEKG